MANKKRMKKEYDSNNNLVYHRKLVGDGYSSDICGEYFYDYDDCGNMIHYKFIHYLHAYPVDRYFYYDENGRCEETKQCSSNGELVWSEKYDYNAIGNLVHEIRIYTSGAFTNTEKWYDYDSNNRIVHEKNSFNEEVWYSYDSENNRNVICWRNKNGNFIKKINHKTCILKIYNGIKGWFYINTDDIIGGSVEGYDKHGRIIYKKSIHKKLNSYEEEWFNYDSNTSYQKNSDGIERWFSLHGKNKYCIKEKSLSTEKTFKYSKNWSLIEERIIEEKEETLNKFRVKGGLYETRIKRADNSEVIFEYDMNGRKTTKYIY